jgi:hypothetical protein
MSIAFKIHSLKSGDCHLNVIATLRYHVNYGDKRNWLTFAFWSRGSYGDYILRQENLIGLTLK